ncbi:diguanylate cyclase domain-containing protein [Achromobacter kerstersii]|uniref:diguanylate cyclase domain-containing protein n=1 Tax=Achromobacter kerstersii TaxID=1353890 RepID=UPI003B8454A7
MQDSYLSDLSAAHLELKASEAHAQHLAFHDVLTGLPNRAYFSASVDQALVRRRPDNCCAIFLLDLDNFKHVNDSWGNSLESRHFCVGTIQAEAQCHRRSSSL